MYNSFYADIHIYIHDLPQKQREQFCQYNTFKGIPITHFYIYFGISLYNSCSSAEIEYKSPYNSAL